MPNERLSRGLLLGLIACLSIGMAVLGIELAGALTRLDRLAPAEAGVLSAAVVLLYAAVAWRAARPSGGRVFAKWWVTMVVAHALLGLTIGAADAALGSAPPPPVVVAGWAGAAALPIAVLQAGFSLGVAALAWGQDGPEETAVVGPEPESPATPAELDPASAPPEALPSPPPPQRLFDVYARALDQIQAQDYASLIRCAAQTAGCQGGLLATWDGLAVAAADGTGWEPTRVAAVLPELFRELQRLAPPAARPSALIHAAFPGCELFAASGEKLVACLIGPQSHSRDAAEIVLPVLVARAETLWRSHQLAGP